MYCINELKLSPGRKARQEKPDKYAFLCGLCALTREYVVGAENDFQSLEQPMDFQSIVVELLTYG